jgi:pimeloyl-ACP methyl ester carboxylesterase
MILSISVSTAQSRFLPQIPMKSVRSLLGNRAISTIATLFGHAIHPLDAAVISTKFFRQISDKIGDASILNTRAIQEVNFPTSDGRLLHGYYIPAEEKTDNVVLFSHGRSGDVNFWCPSMLSLQKGLQGQDKNTNLFLFDYRGYGKSEGNRPTRLTAPKDAYAAWCFLRAANFKPENIHMVGHSTGSAVALKTTIMLEKYRGEKPASLILASSYESPRQAAICAKPGIGPLKVFVVGKTILNPEVMIRKISPAVPVRFIHGTGDKYFPHEHSETLFERSVAYDKDIILREDGQHVEIFTELGPAEFARLTSLFN